MVGIEVRKLGRFVVRGAVVASLAIGLGAGSAVAAVAAERPKPSTPPSTTAPSTTAPATTAPATTAPAATAPTATPTTAPADPPKAGDPAGDAAAGDYIVTLQAGVDPAAVAAEATGGKTKIDHVYRSAVDGFAGTLSVADLARLRNDPRVARIEADQLAHTVADTTQSPAPSWGLDRIDERAPDGTNAYTYATTASNVTAYIIDTGIYAANTDLAGRVAAGRNFVTPTSGTIDPTATNDCDGHGTHVAGTVGGTSYGVAKGVTLVPVRVLDCNGSGSWSDIIAGLDWVTADHDPGELAVANMSIGGGYSSSVNDAVARAVADGVVVVVAAGNSNANACSYSPSSTPSAITVGATDSGDNRASFSNYGSCVDLFAPGVSITSDSIGSTTATATLSGTSMASPHVTGAAALFLAQGKTAADLLANVTTGRVVNAGTASPNKLLYTGTAACDVTSCPPPPPPPANDPFASAQALTPLTGTTTVATDQATKEAGEPNHAGFAGGKSVWFSFTAAGVGTATIDTFGSSYDTLLAVYRGTAVNALTGVVSNDDSSGLQSKVTFTTTAGVTYMVAVDGYGGAGGTAKLNWTLPSSTTTTGWKAPTAQAAVTSSAGDNNGYEGTPANALADDGVFATDANSGTGSSTSCTATTRDKHTFSGYSMAVPSGATVKGIEVQAQAKTDSTTGSPKLCVLLSTDGGSTWTAGRTTATLTKNEAGYTVGGVADLWGRRWTPADFGSNFRVRIVDLASSTARTFSLDVVNVRVTY